MYPQAAPQFTDRPWPVGRRPLDIPVVELQLVAPPTPIATKLCPNRHPNNPDADRCAICQTAIASAAPVLDMTPRPVARLLLEDGTGIDVADRLIVGRSPFGDQTPAGAVIDSDGSAAAGPAPVRSGGRDNTDTLTVTGRQVSRRHMTLEVRGWQLLIRDANSTNGTFLSRRGERGRRRVPVEESIPVHVGDSIHFGSRQAVVVRAR